MVISSISGSICDTLLPKSLCLLYPRTGTTKALQCPLEGLFKRLNIRPDPFLRPHNPHSRLLTGTEQGDSGGDDLLGLLRPSIKCLVPCPMPGRKLIEPFEKTSQGASHHRCCVLGNSMVIHKLDVMGARGILRDVIGGPCRTSQRLCGLAEADVPPLGSPSRVSV